jgi:hypothetical protein
MRRCQTTDFFFLPFCLRFLRYQNGEEEEEEFFFRPRRASWKRLNFSSFFFPFSSRENNNTTEDNRTFVRVRFARLKRRRRRGGE